MTLTPEERRRRNTESVRRVRLRETPEQYEERLRRARERYYAKKSRSSTAPNPRESSISRTPSTEPTNASNNGRCTSSTRGWADNGVPRLHPIPISDQNEALRRLRVALGASGLEEVVCAVCDRWTLQKNCGVVNITDTKSIDNLRDLLSSRGENLTSSLMAEYDCSNLVAALKGILLSKRGVDLSNAGVLRVCEQCGDSLRKHNIPKFSIKNGFYIGSLPTQLEDTTLPERLMTQLVSVVAVTRVMRGGVHRAIRSHCLAFDATPGPAATLLPSRMDGVKAYRVVLVGPFTTEQQARVRKMHCVRRQVVDDLLQFYCAHNPLYADVSIDLVDLANEAVPDSIFWDAHEANDDVSDFDLDHDRVGGVPDGNATVVENEVIERRVVFVSDDREVSAEGAQRIVHPTNEKYTSPQFLVRHSNRFSPSDKLLFPRMFPHLFPYGRGHPGESRRVPVSLDACIRYYSMLSSRRFAEDELFILVSFDHLSLQKMYTQVALKCKRNSAHFEPYSDVNETDLLEALKEKELRRQGRTGLTAPSDAPIATRLLNTVELSCGAIWGSDAERMQCRRKAFAFQTRYGQPSLFVTLSPNVSGSFVMAQYCGITSVDTLFDAELSDMPPKSVLQSASLKNDVASARLFMHNMNAFIEHVLAVAADKMSSTPFDGLFGKVSAYFGMVETQGGGTLHAHFLVWLAAAPPNCDAFDQAMSVHGDQQYVKDLQAYTDSVISTSLSLNIDESTCQFCEHSYSNLEPLPIPDEAFKRTDRRCNKETAEPLLVRCSRCKTKTSSQHVLRRVLLDHRPPSWPPSRRDYTPEELKTIADIEAPRRGSIANAKQAIFLRDSFLAEQGDAPDLQGGELRWMNRVPQCKAQREDEIFAVDEVARSIQIMPPSLDDSRWSSRMFAFAVSMLVFLLNVHWWSHVGSCFKRSRSATQDSCRYGFPRPRVAQTALTSDGVVVARRPACEYVNNYSPVLMAAFKSNHDVQVMVGGATALLRIYYTTKYVTKRQELVESLTAVALAAFRKRQTRELRDESRQLDRASVGRRRVSSLAFALSNRREIAGPLAAFYLLRGSCCYASTPCANLPLINIIKELLQGEAHTCDLVHLSEGENTALYRPVSLLDDYRYRPIHLEKVCLYEYVMKHFRRKQTQSTPATALFQPGHPLATTHCVSTHLSDVIPVIGVHLPYEDSESPPELVLKRRQYALTLFKPFRQVSDLVDGITSERSWLIAYEHWMPTRSSFICEIMANIDDFRRVERQAKKTNVDEGESQGGAEAEDTTGTREEVDQMAEGNDEIVDNTVDTCIICDDDNVAHGDELPVFPTLRNENSSATEMFAFQNLMAPPAEATASTFAYLRYSAATEHPTFTIDEFNQWLNSSSTDEAAPSVLRLDERPTEVIQLILSALEPVNTRRLPNTDPVDSNVQQNYASIASISRAFTLNHRQHIAFGTIAAALLRRFLKQEQGSVGIDYSYRNHDYQTQLREEQLRMFLGGAGGTGKSRVIDAVDAFCNSWRRENCLVKTALTGKAASLIGGRTLASFLMRIQHAIQSRTFAPLDLLVIDEVSMMTKPEWLKLDKLLRRYKQVPNVFFGGVHIVLVGDFLQMPPVGGDAIYVDPNTKPRPSTTDIEGFELWRQFTTIIILEESVRFRSDPEWGDGCKMARLGQWSPEFIKIINSRVLNPSTMTDRIRDSSVFVTPENTKRQAINSAFIAVTTSQLPADVFPLRIVANFKGALNNLSRHDVAYVLGQPDSRFGRMAPFLDVIDGMPIQVTQNVGTAKGVANGTLGSLEYIEFPPATTFRPVLDGATGSIIHVPSHPPNYAMLRLPRPRALSFRPELDSELFPVFPTTEPFSKCRIALPPALNGERRYIAVKIQQFPFVCAVGSTIYKVQGETLHSMLVVDWKSKNNIINKPQQTYLLVSRVTCRTAFNTLLPLTPKLAEWSRPPLNALDEENRLNRLSEFTIAAFERDTSQQPVDAHTTTSNEATRNGKGSP